jgi:hypothetical protein
MSGRTRMLHDDDRNKVELGLNDDISWPVDQRRNDGLDRWRDALRVILSVHGVEVLSERNKQMVACCYNKRMDTDTKGGHQ